MAQRDIWCLGLPTILKIRITIQQYVVSIEILYNSVNEMQLRHENLTLDLLLFLQSRIVLSAPLSHLMLFLKFPPTLV